MSTDAVIPRGHLESSETPSPSWRRDASASLQRIGSLCYNFASYPIGSPSITWTAPKVVEAQRQVARLHAAKKFAEERDCPNDDVEGLTACMSLLGHFAVGPIPIPVASWTADFGPSLFLQTDHFYGDLEVEGDQIEYMLRWTHEGNEMEVFDTEKVSEGRLPPRLLAHLFRAFAKHNAEVL